jgi:nucleoside-diphosphate-sugar epimerase
MRHLVLGSRGQVGQYVVDRAKAVGDEVVEWDVAISQNMDLRVGSSEFVDVMGDVDYVHFLAYNVGGSKYLADQQDSFEFIQDNISIMDNVFSALRMTKKPFYFTSSQMSIMGHSTYGRLKAVGESYTNALGGRVVWFWNVYGYETDPDKAHVITDFIKMARDTGKILCRTSGNERRQFVYAKDVADILVNLAHGVEYPGDILEITNNEWVSIKQLAYDIAARFDAKVYFTDKMDTVQGYMNEPTVLMKYGFTSLQDGIDDLIKQL